MLKTYLIEPPFAAVSVLYDEASNQTDFKPVHEEEHSILLLIHPKRKFHCISYGKSITSQMPTDEIPECSICDISSEQAEQGRSCICCA